MHENKKKFSMVSTSHDLHWETKIYKVKRSIILTRIDCVNAIFTVARKLTPQKETDTTERLRA